MSLGVRGKILQQIETEIWLLLAIPRLLLQMKQQSEGCTDVPNSGGSSKEEVQDGKWACLAVPHVSLTVISGLLVALSETDDNCL